MGIEIYALALILLGVAIIYRIYRNSSKSEKSTLEQTNEQYRKMRKHASNYQINYDYKSDKESYFD